MEIFTIGFTQSTAEDFFGRLRAHDIERLLDVRLSNSSQLAGFAKRDDLAYFLGELVGVDYEHAPLLAPTQEIFDSYKKKKELSWQQFEQSFQRLMVERRIEEKLRREDFERRTVLLCSEATAEHCHRRLVVEYLADRWPGVVAVHL